MRVNPGELDAGGKGLEEAAASIPDPLAPFTSTGTDALSTILSTLTQSKEAPLIAGLPETKAAALATAQNIQAAARMYELSDQQIATDVRTSLSGLDSAGCGAGGAGGATGAGGAGQMQQMMSVTMQMAQQAGQMAQAVTQLPQGVQGVIQQIGQMTGGMGQSAAHGEQRDSAAKVEDTESAPTEGAAADRNDAERAPSALAGEDAQRSGAVPNVTPSKHAQRSDTGIVV